MQATFRVGVTLAPFGRLEAWGLEGRSFSFGLTVGAESRDLYPDALDLWPSHPTSSQWQSSARGWRVRLLRQRYGGESGQAMGPTQSSRDRAAVAVRSRLGQCLALHRQPQIFSSEWATDPLTTNQGITQAPDSVVTVTEWYNRKYYPSKLLLMEKMDCPWEFW